jgi:hypothetical protein
MHLIIVNDLSDSLKEQNNIALKNYKADYTFNAIQVIAKKLSRKRRIKIKK